MGNNLIHKKSLVVMLVIYILCCPGLILAETTYNQPYLGVWENDFLRNRYSAEALKQQAVDNLAFIIRQSDLIILASTENFKEVKSFDEKNHIAFYEGDFKLIEALKGKINVTSLHLRFEPSATSIEGAARHIFFLKKSGKAFKVLKASYIFPNGQGYDNHIRLIGAYDCSADVAIDTIKYLISQKVPVGLDTRLMDEYMSEKWMKMYSAVSMAASTAPDVGNPVLKKVVSTTDRKRFDLQLYGTAAYALARQQKRDTWQAILENIPSMQGYERVPESIAFDLVATIADERIIPLLKEIVAKKPDLAVSTAFALSHIGGKEARRVVESWLVDEQLSRRETVISNGWMSYKKNFGELFKQALGQMKSTDERTTK
jgi:hypothetical protein